MWKSDPDFVSQKLLTFWARVSEFKPREKTWSSAFFKKSKSFFVNILFKIHQQFIMFQPACLMVSVLWKSMIQRRSKRLALFEEKRRVVSATTVWPMAAIHYRSSTYTSFLIGSVQRLQQGGAPFPFIFHLVFQRASSLSVCQKMDSLFCSLWLV